MQNRHAQSGEIPKDSSLCACIRSHEAILLYRMAVLTIPLMNRERDLSFDAFGEFTAQAELKV
jgi:hypothetical protein